jgi:hypothetical protein
MKLAAFPMAVTDWSTVSPTEHPGDSGRALWRTKQMGDVRIRLVEYSPGYSADHWCAKGHVIFCVAGSLEMHLRDGKLLSMKAGQSYHVGDGEPAHRSTTAEGATLFIVD